MSDDLTLKFGADTGALGAAFAHMKEQLAGVGESITQIKESAVTAGEALLALFAVERIGEWINKMSEAAERTQQLGDKLGMSAREIQQWEAVATLTGRSVEQFQSAFTRLTDNLVKGAGGSKQQAAAMRDLGLSAKDALNPAEAVLKAANAFAQQKAAGDTARSIADAMALMGRAGAEMLPVLSQGTDAIQAMMDKGTEFGTVLTDGMNAANKEAVERVSELKLALKGISTEAFAALAPLIERSAISMADFAKSMADALKPGGDFIKLLVAIRDTAFVVGTALATNFVLSLIATEGATILASNAMRLFATRMAFAGVITESMGAITGLGVAFNLLTASIAEATAATTALTVAMLANPITWITLGVAELAAGYVWWTAKTNEHIDAERRLTEAENDLLSIQDRVASMTKEQIENEITLTKAKLADAMATLSVAKAEMDRANAAVTQDKKSGSPSIIGLGLVKAAVGLFDKKEQRETFATWQTDLATVNALMEKTGLLLDGLGKAHSGGSLGALGQGGAGKDARLSEWQQELDQKLDAQGQYFADAKAMELKFWADHRATITGASKEDLALQREIDQKIHSLRRELAQQERTETLNDLKSFADASIKSADQTLHAEMDRLHAKEDAVHAAADLGTITRQQEFAALQKILAEEVAAEQAAAKAAYDARMQQLQLDEVIYRNDAVNLKKTLDEELKLTQDFQGKLTELTAKGNRDRQKLDDSALAAFKTRWDAAINPVVQTFTAGFRAMMAGTKSFAGFMADIGTKILDGFVSGVVEPMIQKWLWKEIGMTMATTLGVGQRVAAETAGAATSTAISAKTAIKEITHAALKAAAGAYSAMAGIPIIGPALGAIAAAATFVAVEALGLSVASAAGGYDIPAGINPITQLHAEEMVLPARYANPLRDMLSGFTANDNRVGAANDGGGGVTHNWNVNTLDPKSFARFLRGPAGQALIDELLTRRRGGAAIGVR